MAFVIKERCWDHGEEKPRFFKGRSGPFATSWVDKAEFALCFFSRAEAWEMIRRDLRDHPRCFVVSLEKAYEKVPDQKEIYPEHEMVRREEILAILVGLGYAENTEVYRKIAALPAVDPWKVMPIGYWVPVSDDDQDEGCFECSLCGYAEFAPEGTPLGRHCTGCGHKMLPGW